MLVLGAAWVIVDVDVVKVEPVVGNLDAKSPELPDYVVVGSRVATKVGVC